MPDPLEQFLVQCVRHAQTRQDGKPGPPTHDDLIGRDFTADAPNQLWLSDITEHRTSEGKLYLCAINAMFSNRIVGYSIDSRMKSRLATQALNSAVARRGEVAGCVVHSGRGSQFRSRKFAHVLNRHDIVRSMGRVGAASDTAAMEWSFSLLQNNVPDRRRWDTREQLRIGPGVRPYHTTVMYAQRKVLSEIAERREVFDHVKGLTARIRIVTWIERTYHRRRRQVGLGRLTPIEFEAIMNEPLSADPRIDCQFRGHPRIRRVTIRREYASFTAYKYSLPSAVVCSAISRGYSGHLPPRFQHLA